MVVGAIVGGRRRSRSSSRRRREESESVVVEWTSYWDDKFVIEGIVMELMDEWMKELTE